MRRSALLLGLALATAAHAQDRRLVMDAPTVSSILDAARGASAMMCELAARSVEQQWGWGNTMFRPPAEDPVVRAAVIGLNRGHTSPEAVPMLTAALSDGDGCVRRLAAPLLGRVDHPSALAALRTALRDDSPATREMAAVAMGFSDNAALIPALLGGIQDPVARVRAACVHALGEIGDHRATGALTRVLREDRDDTVRAAAAWAIGEIEG